MRSRSVTGIILKRKNSGEADVFLTILTDTQGKIVVKAKGVRKITSRRGASLELFNLCKFALYEVSEGAMPVVTEVALINSHAGIKQELARVGIAYHICELIEGLVPERQSTSPVFELSKQVLLDLSRGSVSVAHCVHRFEVDLLTTLGYVGAQDLSGSRASVFIEEILERKLKTRHILPQLLG